MCIWLGLNWLDWLDGACEWKRRGGLERGVGEKVCERKYGESGKGKGERVREGERRGEKGRELCMYVLIYAGIYLCIYVL